MLEALQGWGGSSWPVLLASTDFRLRSRVFSEDVRCK